VWDSVVNSDGSRYLPKTRVPGLWKCHGVMRWVQIEWIFFLFVSIFLLCLKFFCKCHMLFKNCWGISKNQQIMWQKYWKRNFQKSLLTYWPTSWFDSGYQEPKFQVYHDPSLVADELNSILVHESNDEKIIYTSQHMYRNIDVNNLKKFEKKAFIPPISSFILVKPSGQ